MASNHRYHVEWSAPNYRNSIGTNVLAKNKPDAIKAAKRKLGSKVKVQRLHHFDAWRIPVRGSSPRYR
ncbi:hypothetical protein LCGC14_2967310 [marine sediment metagenome]|uniref:Uncharacterized protein n=1 Tax=marine sediment metagenome TaxID=412755 RepID=A0A0F9A1Q4_9ZZZZ